MRRLLGWLLDLLYPRDCFFCGRPAGEGGHICVECLERLSLHRNPSCTLCGAESSLPEGPDFVCSDCLRRRPTFERAFVVARYDGALRDLIQAFKYRRGLWLLEDLTRFLVAAYLARISPLGLRFDAVVPVPMQPAKLRARGYNQAELLARGVSRQLGIPLRTRLLRRVGTGVLSQTRLRREGRIQNAAAAYRVAHPKHLRGKTLLLVDDVMTTGATCEACARLLRRAGAAKVYVLALARPLMS